jgi:hypothetical protein
MNRGLNDVDLVLDIRKNRPFGEVLEDNIDKPVVGYAEKAEPSTFATPSPKSCKIMTYAS